MRHLLSAICLITATAAPIAAQAHPDHLAPLTTSPAPLDPQTPVQLTHVALTLTSGEQPLVGESETPVKSSVRGDYTLKNPTDQPLDVEFMVPAVLCELFDGKPDCELDVDAPDVAVSARGKALKPARKAAPPKKGPSWTTKKRVAKESPVYVLTLAPGESATISLASSVQVNVTPAQPPAADLKEDRWRHDMTGAAAWSGPVGELRLTVELLQRPTETHVPKQLKLEEVRTVIGADKLHHTTIKLVATDVEPEASFALRWADLVPCHPYSDNQTAGEFYPATTSAEAVIDVKEDRAKWEGKGTQDERPSTLGAWLDDLYAMNADQLGVCRNSFYAHYGYSFKKAKYTKQFYKTPAVKGGFLVIGYTPDPGFQSKHMSAVELSAAQTVKKVEALKSGAGAEEE
jgi:hypothetical protein